MDAVSGLLPISIRYLTLTLTLVLSNEDHNPRIKKQKLI